MNGFQKHGLPHVSASAINAWIYSKRDWVLQYLFKQKRIGNAAMHRGLCVERAIASILMSGKDERGVIEEAIKHYDMELMFSRDPNIILERGNISLMVRQGLAALALYGKPDEPPKNTRYRQHKVTAICKTASWDLPVIGYLDLLYSGHKFIIDIKTVNKLPEEMPAAHRRQAAIYQCAMPEYDVVFQYLAPDGATAHQVDGVPELMAGIKGVLIEQEAFLSQSVDKDILLNYVTGVGDERYRTP